MMWSAKVRAQPWAPRCVTTEQVEKESWYDMWRDSEVFWRAFTPQIERGGGGIIQEVPVVSSSQIDAYYDGPEYAVDEMEAWEQAAEYDRWVMDLVSTPPSNNGYL